MILKEEVKQKSPFHPPPQTKDFSFIFRIYVDLKLKDLEADLGRYCIRIIILLLHVNFKSQLKIMIFLYI